MKTSMQMKQKSTSSHNDYKLNIIYSNVRERQKYCKYARIMLIHGQNTNRSLTERN